MSLSDVKQTNIINLSVKQTNNVKISVKQTINANVSVNISVEYQRSVFLPNMSFKQTNNDNNSQIQQTLPVLV